MDFVVLVSVAMRVLPCARLRYETFIGAQR